MNFVSRGVALFALFGGASSAFAGTISLQYLVNTANWLPTDFSNTGSWNTYQTTDILITNPGLQIPGIQQAFIDQNVPVELRGNLLGVTLRVEGFTRWDYTLDNGGGAADATVNLTGTLSVQTPVTTAPGGPPFSAPTGTPIFTVVSEVLNKLEANVPAQDNTGETFSVEQNRWVPDFAGGDIRTGADQDTGDSGVLPYTSGTVFDAFNSAGTVFLPITFGSSALATGPGNFDIRALTFGAARVSISYSYLPESEWAWAGLPFVAGGWLVRRRLALRSKN